MRFLLEPVEPGGLDELTAFADVVSGAGLDGILLRQSPAVPSPLMVAVALAGRVSDLLLAVEVELGDRHPFELAEEAAVVDCAAAGRLVLVTRPAQGAEADYGEALDLIRTALTPRPFRFAGRRWQVPAGLAENEYARDTHVRLTPAPAQAQLPVWGAGSGRDAALERGLGYLGEPDTDPGELAAAYDRAAARLGAAMIGAPRARREQLRSAPELVAQLQAGREAFEQDWAVVVTDGEGADLVGHQVRPRVQLHHLDPALQALWEVAR